MTVQLFIKKLPDVIKELISREALDNRRSINQEAIALLEEALVNRVGSLGEKRRSAQVMLEDYAARPRSPMLGEGFDAASSRHGPS